MKTITMLHQQQHIAFFGVYDGHGGEKAAIFTGEKLHHLIKETKNLNKRIILML